MAKRATTAGGGLNLFTEVGRPGLKIWAGYVREEFLTELRGTPGRKVIREMIDNDPIIGACWGTIKQFLRAVSIRAVAASEEPEAQQARDLVDTSLSDMSLTWSDTLTDILSFGPYGWSYLELLYKRREGDQRDPSRRSKHNDGLISWRKLALRAHQSLQRWELDAEGGVQGMWQTPPAGGGTVLVPIDKALLFRTEHAGGNPEGRSLLRNAYVPFYFTRRLRQTEAIGIERDLNGIPKIGLPIDYLDPNASAAKVAARDEFMTIGRNLRNDEQACVLYPLAYDQQGHKLFEVELLSNTGRRNHDITGAIERYSREMAMALLVDFLLLGHENVGSFALLRGRSKLFSTAIGGWLEAILEVFNRHGIPRLIALNGMRAESAPHLERGDIEAPDLAELGQYLANLTQAGFSLFTEPDLQDHLLQLARLPVSPEAITDIGKRRPTRQEILTLMARELAAQQPARVAVPDVTKGGWDETESSFRYRLREPGRFAPRSFRTVALGDGVKSVMGKLKGETTMTAQSLVFSKDTFTEAEAKAWLKTHPEMQP